MPNKINQNKETSPESKKINPILAATVATVISLTQVQASDLLSQCGTKYDYNKNWKIDKWGEEYVCKMKIKNIKWRKENAELAKENAEWRKENAKLDKENAELDKKDKEHKERLKRQMEEIKNMVK